MSVAVLNGSLGEIFAVLLSERLQYFTCLYQAGLRGANPAPTGGGAEATHFLALALSSNRPI